MNWWHFCYSAALQVQIKRKEFITFFLSNTNVGQEVNFVFKPQSKAHFAAFRHPGIISFKSISNLLCMTLLQRFCVCQLVTVHSCWRALIFHNILQKCCYIFMFYIGLGQEMKMTHLHWSQTFRYTLWLFHLPTDIMSYLKSFTSCFILKNKELYLPLDWYLYLPNNINFRSVLVLLSKWICYTFLLRDLLFLFF